MAENLAVESPDFDKIRKEAGLSTQDAIRLLWFVLNQEIADRRRGFRETKERREGKVLSAAPTAQQDNYDSQGAFVLEFTGATNFTFTGIRNPLTGRVLIIHNTGSANITIAHQNAGSDEANRIVTVTGANKTVATNESMILQYLSGRWREFSAA